MVEHSTDIARLKKERADMVDAKGKAITGSETIVIQNAIVLTMAPGSSGGDRIQNGVVVIKNGVIHEVGAAESVTIPLNSQIVDAKGGEGLFFCFDVSYSPVSAGYVVPGFIDVHAHWGGFDSRYPAKSWEMETFLAYGVTTVHKYVHF